MRKLLLPLLFLLLTSAAYANTVHFMQVDGVITGFTGQFLEKAIERAEADNASALVLRIDTPGGLLDATRDIVQQIFASPVPVVAFVAPQGARAGSAGTFIVLASHKAVMAEGTNIGAAHPVSATGENIEGDMRKKVENDTVAFIRSIAQKRDRDADVAARTVTDSASFTAQGALNAKLIDAIANTDDELVAYLAAQYGWKGDVTRVETAPDRLERVAFFLSDPNVLVLLLLLGLMCIFLEIKMPGTFVFAATGIASLALFLMGINIIPVNWLGVVLVLGGIALLVAEIYITSFGLLAAAGIAALGGGLYLLFDHEGTMGVRVGFGMIGIVVGVVGAVVLGLGYLLLRDMKRRPAVGTEKFTGMTGVVKSSTGMTGMVFLNGELWKFRCSESVVEGEVVRVLLRDGMELAVEKLEKDS